MLPKQLVLNWMQKLIYGWLIFCIGGVGPLTYFDGFTPGHAHDEHPYHWTIFEGPPHVHNPLPPLSETLAEQDHFWLISHLTFQTELLISAQSLTSGFSRFFTSGLSDGYILTASHLKVVNLPARFSLITLVALTGRSAWLAPPDKPPTFSL